MEDDRQTFSPASMGLILILVLTQISNGGAYEYVSFNTSGKHVKYINDIGVKITGAHSMVLKIKTCSKAYLILTEAVLYQKTKSYYVVMLDRTEKPRLSSILEGCLTCTAKASSSIRMLYCSFYKVFWLSWDDKGFIQIGRGHTPYKNMLMSHRGSNKFTINYIQAMSHGHAGDWQVRKDCPPGRYGARCILRCGQCACANDCDPNYGRCKKGCKAGWRGIRCKRACGKGTYGTRCQRCGHCKDKAQCNRVTGHCPGLCEPGWTGDHCDEYCPNSTHGVGCQKCGHCSLGENCHRETGRCETGCDLGWMGQKCDQECMSGSYGANCSSTCGHCGNNTACDKVNGICAPDTVCEPGWSGYRCDKACPPGTFGLECMECGHCKDDALCHVTTGICTSGCADGWTGTRCDKECGDGTWGMYCKLECGQCQDGEPCDKVTGRCPGECAPGWTGCNCDAECTSGTYGASCKEECGWCKDEKPCDRVTGICENGCYPGTKGDKCEHECADGSYGNNCSAMCGHCMDDLPCESESGFCLLGCSPGWEGLRCDRKGSGVPGDMNTTKTKLTNPVKPDKVAAISLGITLVIMVICAISGGLIAWRRCRKPEEELKVHGIVNPGANTESSYVEIQGEGAFKTTDGRWKNASTFESQT
ncbi:multiple epidermal growth factor-like domains protein 10 [Haliotis asinina]|uniref:multiple epidermal growth factor-like domains protein 10 n=1 Tax=Haliotis asinina TaxID=109174 RepID=UPI0035324BDA